MTTPGNTQHHSWENTIVGRVVLMQHLLRSLSGV